MILVRHGRTTANASGVLAGRLAGVRLDETGTTQAERAAERIAALEIAALVTSPQERCRQTARILGAAQAARGRARLRAVTDKGLAECDYGSWQGHPLKELAKEKLWVTVQKQPSAATFPDGESLITMQRRAVEAVRRRDAAVAQEHGPGAVWVAVSHGDIIKSLLADALGMHLDLFQRIVVDPASVSVISYTPDRPVVLGMNTHDGDLGWLAAPASRRVRRPDETLGGGAGPAAPTPAPSAPDGH